MSRREKLPLPLRLREMTLSNKLLYWARVAACSTTGRSIFVLGYPRSGTTWLSRLLSDATSLERYEIGDPLTSIFHPAVIQTHRFFPFSGFRKRCIYIVRDGRDALVSRYFMECRDRAAGKKQKTPSGIKYDPDEIVGNLPAFIRFHMRSHKTSLPYQEHVALALRKQYPVIRYEDLLVATVKMLRKTLLDIGETAAAANAKESVQRNSFQVLSGRPRGEENAGEAIRKGMPGDWKNYFSREASEVFEAFAGSILYKLGYEKNCRWVEAQAPAEELVRQFGVQTNTEAKKGKK